MAEREWRKARLGDIVRVNPDTLSARTCLPHIHYIDITAVEEGYIAVEPAKMLLTDAPSRARRLLQPGDTVLATVRPNRRAMFYAAQPAEDWVVSTGFAVLRPNKALIEPRYLYACVFARAFTDYLVSREKGAAYPAVSTEDIANATIPLPPLAEQKRIAHILGTLDDKIELNRRMCRTLEEMARALFKSWFVDFDPVRAKAAGRQPAGMDAATAALFPDSFVDSELGPIPRGWEVRRLDEIADFLNGLALQKYPARAGEPSLPAIKIAELRRGVTEQSGRASLEVPAAYIVEDGDVLFSWSGSLDCVVWAGGCGALNQHLFKVTSPLYPKWFYFHWVLAHLPHFQQVAAGKATTMGHIQRHHLKASLCVVPEAPLLAKADHLLGPLLERQVAGSLQSRQLAIMRDALLPRLLADRPVR